MQFTKPIVDIDPAGQTERIVRCPRRNVTLRVACWPMGFILLAKGDGKLFFWTELASNCLQVGLIFAGVLAFGLKGVGIAFFALYVFYTLGIYVVVRRLNGFRWSQANCQLGLFFFSSGGLRSCCRVPLPASMGHPPRRFGHSAHPRSLLENAQRVDPP